MARAHLRLPAVIATAMVACALAGCAGGEETDVAVPEDRCIDWVHAVEDGTVNASRPVRQALFGASADEFCHEADERNALERDGTVTSDRLAEVSDCQTLGVRCAPRRLAVLLLRDRRVKTLDALGRRVLLRGLVAMADYDGVAHLLTSVGSPFDDDYKKLRGMAALAHEAGVTVAEAQAAMGRLESRGLVSRDEQCDPDRPFTFDPDEPPCFNGPVIDEALVSLAQRYDRGWRG